MDVLGLDLSVFVLTSLCFFHACIKRSDVILLFSGGILGLLVEQASLRFGGTHCHASGLIDVSDCSSLNSVLFYAPWVTRF